MRKVALVILGLASLAGIISIISAIYLIFVQLITIGYIGDPDPIQFNIWIVFPTILAIYLTFKLWKDQTFYERYKLTVGFATWGIIITVLASLLWTIFFVLNSQEGFGILISIGILIMGSVASLVLAIIGWFIDRKRNRIPA